MQQLLPYSSWTIALVAMFSAMNSQYILLAQRTEQDDEPTQRSPFSTGEVAPENSTPELAVIQLKQLPSTAFVHILQQLNMIPDDLVAVAITTKTVIVRGRQTAINEVKRLADLIDLSVAIEVLPDGSEEEKSRTRNEADENQASQFRVQGRITDIAGNPMAGVEVRASTGYGTLSIGGHGTTDDNGRYAFQFLPGFAGNPAATIGLQAAIITAHKVGYFELNLNRQGNWLMASVIPVEENRSYAGVFLPGKTERIDFVMAPAGVIRGHLVDHEGHPLANRRLSLKGTSLPPSSSVLDSTETSNSGHFEFPDVPGSPYSWWFELQGSDRGKARVAYRSDAIPQFKGSTLLTVQVRCFAGSDKEPPSLECTLQRKEPRAGLTGSFGRYLESK